MHFVADMENKKKKVIRCPECNNADGVEMVSYEPTYGCRFCENEFEINEDEYEYNEEYDEFDEDWEDMNDDFFSNDEM